MQWHKWAEVVQTINSIKISLRQVAIHVQPKQVFTVFQLRLRFHPQQAEQTVHCFDCVVTH